MSLLDSVLSLPMSLPFSAQREYSSGIIDLNTPVGSTSNAGSTPAPMPSSLTGYSLSNVVRNITDTGVKQTEAVRDTVLLFELRHGCLIH